MTDPAGDAANSAPMLLIADLDVADPRLLARYGADVQPIMAKYGGRILGVSAAGAEVVEGEWNPGLLIVHEWTSRAGFDAFWASPEYQPVREVRHKACSESRIAVFDRIEPPRAGPS